MEFFKDLRGKIEFLEQTMSWQPCGASEYTYSDVERAVITRLRAADVLTAYRALRAAEIEGAERELLRRLQAKYVNGECSVQPPLLRRAPATKGTPRAPATQQSLF